MTEIKQLRRLQLTEDMDRQHLVDLTRTYLYAIGQRIEVIVQQHGAKARLPLWSFVSHATKNARDGEYLERLYLKIKALAQDSKLAADPAKGASATNDVQNSRKAKSSLTSDRGNNAALSGKRISGDHMQGPNKLRFKFMLNEGLDTGTKKMHLQQTNAESLHQDRISDFQIQQRHVSSKTHDGRRADRNHWHKDDGDSVSKQA